MLHLAYFAGILSKVVARRRTRRYYSVVSCRAPQTYFYHFWSLYNVHEYQKCDFGPTLVLGPHGKRWDGNSWVLIDVEGLAEEVDGSESFPSCNVDRKSLDWNFADWCWLRSFEAGTNNFFEQANTKSYFVLKTSLHKTLDNTFIVAFTLEAT